MPDGPRYPSRMALYHLIEPGPPIVDPIVVAAFDGWVDAGIGGDERRSSILGDEAEPVATFDADQLFDYRVPPPHARDPRRPADVARLARAVAPPRPVRAASTCWS